MFGSLSVFEVEAGFFFFACTFLPQGCPEGSNFEKGARVKLLIFCGVIAQTSITYDGNIFISIGQEELVLDEDQCTLRPSTPTATFDHPT